MTMELLSVTSKVETAKGGRQVQKQLEKIVFGVYNSNQELLAAIKDLQAKGLPNTKMTVAADIKAEVQIGAENKGILVIANQDEDTFLERIIHFFTEEGSGDLRSYFNKYGYSITEINEMLETISKKKLILFVDEEAYTADLQA